MNTRNQEIEQSDFSITQEKDYGTCKQWHISSEQNGERIDRLAEFHYGNKPSKNLIVCLEGKEADEKTRWIEMIRKIDPDVLLLTLNPIGTDIFSREREYLGNLYENQKKFIDFGIQQALLKTRECSKSITNISILGFSLSANLAMAMFYLRKDIQNLLMLSPAVCVLPYYHPDSETSKHFINSKYHYVSQETISNEKAHVYISVPWEEFSYQYYQLLADVLADWQDSQNIYSQIIKKLGDSSYLLANPNFLHILLADYLFHQDGYQLYQINNINFKIYSGTHSWETWQKELFFIFNQCPWLGIATGD